MPTIESPTRRFMRQTTYGLALLIFSTIAWVASGALSLERLELYKDANHVASCDFGLFVSCTSLMKTSQASLLGFPNPFLGIVGFAITATIAVVLMTGVKLPRWFFIALQVGITLAMALVTFFWITSVYTVMTLCPWCMGVWAMVIPMFMLTTAYNIYHGNIWRNVSEKAKKVISEWWWISTILIIVGVVASILFRFAEYMF